MRNCADEHSEQLTVEFMRAKRFLEIIVAEIFREDAPNAPRVPDRSIMEGLIELADLINCAVEVCRAREHDARKP